MASLTYASFDVYPGRGFLPKEDPLRSLPPAFAAWEEAAAELPKLLASDKTRERLASLPLPDVSPLQTKEELERAMMLLSFLGHGYIWCEKKPPVHIPRSLAVPWHAVATALDRPPCLSYSSYALHNWRRINPNEPVAMGNIALLQNFLAGIDEEWFVIVHVDIEAKAAPAILCLFELQEAAAKGDAAGLKGYLRTVDDALAAMYASLSRMYEQCDPYVYYNRVRPYIHGWQDNPAIPDGLIYEGVTAYHGKKIALRGETGAQSTLIPSLDAVFGTAHLHGPLSAHLQDMRRYMPKPHRAFLEKLEQGPVLRDCISKLLPQEQELKDSFNSCVTWIEKFREKHLEFAVSYIDQQQQSSVGNPTSVGTGATPYVDYLRLHKEHTRTKLL